MSEGRRPATAADYHERILRVLVHIQSHLDDAICIDDLARIACFSPFHFHHVFSGMVGEGVMEHIRRLRLERAAARLTTTDNAVVGIAFEAGFESHEAFSRAFKSMFGVSPTEFRSSRRAAPPPLAVSGVHFDPSGRLKTFIPVKGDNSMQVNVENFTPRRVAFMRHIGPYQDVGATWQRLMAWAGPRGIFGPDTQMLGLAYDNPQVTPADKLRYDACVTVGAGVQPQGEVGVQEIAGGDYAVALHVGPYEQLHHTYSRLFGQWLPASGRAPRDLPCVERYLNSPMNASPEQLQTQVCVPIS